jgi:hypothetical protein
MTTRSELLQNAIDHTQGLDLTNSAYGDKRSLFGVLRSLLLIASEKAEDEQMETCRTMLRKAQGLKGKRFKGVQLDDLKRLIRFLFEDNDEFLSPKYFGGYSLSSLLGYLEICRRIFVTQIQFKSQPLAQPVDCNKNEPTREESWHFYGMGMLEIQLALKNRNRDCARFVVEHKNKSPNKKIVKLAESILESES